MGGIRRRGREMKDAVLSGSEHDLFAWCFVTSALVSAVHVDVRFGSKTAACWNERRVRFTRESGHYLVPSRPHRRLGSPYPLHSSAVLTSAGRNRIFGGQPARDCPAATARMTMVPPAPSDEILTVIAEAVLPKPKSPTPRSGTSAAVPVIIRAGENSDPQCENRIGDASF